MIDADAGLLALLQLSDSLFPIGAFAHSDGLEAASACGAVRTADDLRAWLRAQLDGPLRRTDGPAIALALGHWHARRWPELSRLDDEVHALRPSSAARQASRAMGTRLLKTWQAVRSGHDGDAFLGGRGSRGTTLPVAFAIACASANVTDRPAVAGFFYTRLAGAVSAAMRLIAIGQTEAHTLLTEQLAQVPAIVDAVLACGDPPGAFTPVLDITAMSHQYVHSRLFRS